MNCQNLPAQKFLPSILKPSADKSPNIAPFAARFIAAICSAVIVPAAILSAVTASGASMFAVIAFATISPIEFALAVAETCFVSCILTPVVLFVTEILYRYGVS